MFDGLNFKLFCLLNNWDLENSHVHSDESRLDGKGIFLCKVFEVSVDFLGGGEDVDVLSLNFPGTGSASALWHDLVEVSPLVINGFLDTSWVATKFRGWFNKRCSENFMDIS